MLISPPSLFCSSFAFSQYIVACFYSFRPKLLLRSVRGKKKRRSKAPLKNSPPPWQRVASLLIEFSGFSAAARCGQIYFNSIRLFNEPKRVKFGIQEIPIFTKDFRIPYQPQQRELSLDKDRAKTRKRFSSIVRKVNCKRGKYYCATSISVCHLVCPFNFLCFFSLPIKSVMAKCQNIFDLKLFSCSYSSSTAIQNVKSSFY